MGFSNDVDEDKGASASVLAVLKKPVVIILIVGLLIRFVLAPLFTYTYDIAHWAVVIQHIQSGFGLYSVPAYYYTPVWGYMLGTFSLTSNFVFDVQPMASFFESLMPVEGLPWSYFTPEVTTTVFNVFMKVPFIICDVIVGALIYYLIKEKTDDEKKATYGFALWFLCPIVIYMSSVQAMFDTFSVLFMFLSILLMYKGRYFSGGAMLSIAIFTKFFPLYVAIPMLAYIILKSRGDKALLRKNILMGVAGLVIMTVILYIPVIMEGSFVDSMYFMIYRAESAGVSGGGLEGLIQSIGYLAILVLQPAIFGFIIYISYRLTKSTPEEADNNFFFVLLLAATAAFVWIPAPQYLMIIIPMLAYYIAVCDKRYFWPWLIMTAGATIFALVMNNFSVLTSLAAYTNLLDLGWVLGIMEWIQQPIFGTTLLQLLIISTGLIEGIGIFYILWIWFDDKLKRRTPI
ncbi:MAG: glycosyltransferase family 39 protein [Methanomassiliicoccaceae archaeon]|nr:glycosyltransferase family 39 protein [Methanomassiliicoccaceae archaeon]